MSMLSRIYVWSLVFESLLFFQLLPQGTAGVNLNLGRALQAIVVLYLLPKGLAVFISKKFSPGNLIYRNYVIFFSIAVFAGLMGALSGAYQSPVQFDDDSSSIFARILNSTLVRPFFEYFIYLYYFIYFTVLPQHILKKEYDIKYFFSIFTKVFIVSFIVGVVDVGLHVAGTGLYVGRLMFEARDIGMRFHGLAGEPRDAVVYLFFGLAMLHLRAYYDGKGLTKRWIVAIVAAALMTQSASGLVGIGFFMILYSTHLLTTSINVRKVLAALVAGAAIILLYYIAVINSERIMLYVDELPALYAILESGRDIPPVAASQIHNIFPAYKMLLNVREFNALPVVIGSGLGSSSSVNLVLGSSFALASSGDLANPQSQFIRIIYEVGLMGLFFFYRSFLRPVEYLVKHVGKSKKDAFILMILLLLGLFFGHRSSTIFIYLGILIAVFRLPEFQAYAQFRKMPSSPEPVTTCAVSKRETRFA